MACLFLCRSSCSSQTIWTLAKTYPLANGGRVVQGVEFDVLGRRAAYWMYPSHPGDSLTTTGSLLAGSKRVPASKCGTSSR
jgi:capsid protein